MTKNLDETIKRNLRLDAAMHGCSMEEEARRILRRALTRRDRTKGHGVLVASHTKIGRPISVEDAQIAAIALVHGLTMATRNTADFENIDGLKLICPWDFNK